MFNKKNETPVTATPAATITQDEPSGLVDVKVGFTHANGKPARISNVKINNLPSTATQGSRVEHAEETRLHEIHDAPKTGKTVTVSFDIIVE